MTLTNPNYIFINHRWKATNEYTYNMPAEDILEIEDAFLKCTFILEGHYLDMKSAIDENGNDLFETLKDADIETLTEDAEILREEENYNQRQNQY